MCTRKTYTPSKRLNLIWQDKLPLWNLRTCLRLKGLNQSLLTFFFCRFFLGFFLGFLFGFLWRFDRHCYITKPLFLNLIRSLQTVLNLPTFKRSSYDIVSDTCDDKVCKGIQTAPSIGHPVFCTTSSQDIHNRIWFLHPRAIQILIPRVVANY